MAAFLVRSDCSCVCHIWRAPTFKDLHRRSLVAHRGCCIPGYRRISLIWLSKRQPHPSRLSLATSCAFLSLLTFHLLFGPPYFRSDPIKSTVVDDRTGVPVQRASIRAEWRLRKFGTLEEDFPAGLLHAETATSGTDGSFTLRGWGPTARPLLTWLAPDDPTITIVTPSGVRTVLSNAAPTRIWADGKDLNNNASNRSTNWRFRAPAETLQSMPSVTVTAPSPSEPSN